MSLRRRALFLLGLFVAVSCSDAGNPLEPGPRPQPEPRDDAIQALQCSVDIPTSTMQCAPRDPDAGGAQAAQMITGGQKKYVVLTASNFANTPTSLELDVTVQNLMRQALGTENGDSLHANGVRVWFASDPANATVDSMSGTAMLIGAPTPYFQYDSILRTGETSDPKRWRFDFASGTTNVQFFVYVVAHVQFPNGWVEITPNPVLLAPGDSIDLSGVAYAPRADSASAVHQTLTWSSDNPAIAEVTNASTGMVKANALGTATVTATNNTPGNGSPVKQSGTVTVIVNSPVQAVDDSVDAVANVPIFYPDSVGLLRNDTDADSTSQDLWVVEQTVVTANGTAQLDSTGSFTYLSNAGFSGVDVVPYTVTDGTDEDQGTLTVVVGERFWYVQPGAASNGDGRRDTPFNTLAAADAASSGTETILVLGGGGSPAAGAGIALNNGQHLIGQGIPAHHVLTLMGGKVSVTLLQSTGVSPVIRANAGATVTLGQNNTIRGVNIEAASGAAVTGNGFGTLTAGDALILNPTGGPALDLTNGALNSVNVFSLSSTNSATTGLSLSNVTGSLTGTGGSITGSTGTAINVAGGSVAVTLGGNASKGSAGLLLSVSGNHTGALAFNGALSATAGSGISFNDADGSYGFNGTTTLSGGPGVAIGNGSDGVFAFGVDTDITNSTGTAFDVNGSTPTVTYSGDISQGNNVLLVSVAEQSADSVIFGTGTLSATNGQGIFLSNADGVVRFNGTTTLNGGDAGVDVVSGSGGTIAFGTGASITNGTGTGLNILDSEPTLTFAGSISTSVGRPVSVDGASPCGTIVVSGNVTGTAQGILVQDCSAGSVSFTGAKTLNTGANAALTLTNNNGGSVSLTGGALGITTSTGAGILGNGAGGFGSLTVSNATINATNGPALNLTNGTVNATFGSLTSANSATNGVSLTTVNGTVTVTGGSITGSSGIAMLISGGGVDVSYTGNVTQASNAALLSVTGGHTGDLAFPAGTVSASNGSGLQFDNADGTYDFDGTVTLNGGDAGIDVTNGSGGTFTFPQAATITSPSTGNLISILNSVSPLSFTYSGGLSKPVSNNVTGILISSNTGGTITFDGDATSADGDPADVARTINSGTAAAVNLSSNTGATVNFNGGGLNLTTTSGAGFTATGGGTVNVTGAGNQVNSTGGGTAVNIQNTTIGGSGVSFYRVDATGGGTNGIVLSSTGAGGFQVTGDGASDEANTTRGRTTARSGGGTIVLGSGGTISGRSGHGVSLATTGPVILRNMVIQGSGSSGDGINASSTGRLTIDNTRITGHASDHGILGNTVSGLALHHSEVDNNGTTVGVVEGPDIWNVRLLGLTGTDTIRNSNIHHSQENVLGIINTSGVLNLTVLNTNITDTGTGAGGTTALMVAANGSSNVTLNVQSVNIERGRSRGIQIGTEAASSAVLNLTVNNSQFLQNGAAIDVSHGSSGTNTFSITNNNVQAGAGSLQAIIVNRAASPSFNGFGLFSGTVSGNTIGTAGTAGSGSDTSSGIEVESNGSGGITRVAVVNNTIREVGTHGIQVAAVDANLGGTAQPTLEARVQGNNVSVLDPVGLDGINVLLGALNTDDLVMCLDIISNTSTGVRNGLRVRGSGAPTAPATAQLEGWDGVTARSTYFTARPNTLTGGVAAYNENVPSAPGGYVAVANCNTP